MLKPLTLIIATIAAPAAAQEIESHVSDAYGTHNPEELSLRGALDRLRHGEWHPMTSALGYGAAKAGMHEMAREIFTDSAARGNVQGITWLSWMEDNGLAGPENPEAAAMWDRKAMELGSEVATFNYGLDVLRGRGVPLDQAYGEQIIRQAAAMGDTSAQHLIDNDFDLDSVTPDADEWKYEQRLF
ncbi:sel1 repeat family protein [Rhodovulum sp. FJ3]|uniref:tetratricopeptide repeat protein n=1 Tax=Rhodovulum sp. FJ3 TaxID=3079053 RepID=UPI00293DE0CE|nr:sel1 repeat family protein [Rhodovulum sp. FJ3]MDV4169633.1 sel1 repeat family protein [Rhodovulum sp. FJ3]